MRHVARHRSIVVCLATLACLSTSAVHAQVAIIAPAVDEADWDSTVLAEGVVWRSHHFDALLGLQLFVNVLDVDLESPGIYIDVVAPDSGFSRTSGLGRMVGGVAAINGSYFEPDGSSSMFLQQEGQVEKADDNGKTTIWEEGAVAVDRNGHGRIVRASGPSWQAMGEHRDVLVSGPLLVWEGEVQQPVDVSFNVSHHPRTAVGVTADGHLLFVTVDGRDPQSAGMTILEMALLMQALGSESALNLDGGGSTTMWVDGSGIVNHPSDNDKFDHLGERMVPNAIAIIAPR